MFGKPTGTKKGLASPFSKIALSSLFNRFSNFVERFNPLLAGIG